AERRSRRSRKQLLHPRCGRGGIAGPDLLAKSNRVSATLRRVHHGKPLCNEREMRRVRETERDHAGEGKETADGRPYDDEFEQGQERGQWFVAGARTVEQVCPVPLRHVTSLQQLSMWLQAELRHSARQLG